MRYTNSPPYRRRRRRRSLRLPGYDYTRAGAYFVTICTQDRAWLFGKTIPGGIRWNDAGRMIQSVWDAIPSYYPGVEIDEFVVMPNHVHGIVVLVGEGRDGRDPRDGEGQPRGAAPPHHDRDIRHDSPASPFSLSDVMHRFKSLTTRRYADGVKQYGWRPFRRRLWQRNYYERIVRDATAMRNIRRYIRNNPTR